MPRYIIIGIFIEFGMTVFEFPYIGLPFEAEKLSVFSEPPEELPSARCLLFETVQEKTPLLPALLTK